MRKENKYAIAFDANKDFREIRIMDDPNEPFTIDKDMTGGSIYVFTQKEFKNLSGLDKCVTAGDGGVYYVGDLFDKGNGKGNGKQ